jgi:hypothetical protein
MREMLSRAALAGVAILALSGLFTNVASEEPSGSPILEPRLKLGRTPVVHLTYHGWATDWTGSVTQADLAAGRIPLVNWEPATSTSPRSSTGASMLRS